MLCAPTPLTSLDGITECSHSFCRGVIRILYSNFGRSIVPGNPGDKMDTRGNYPISYTKRVLRMLSPLDYTACSAHLSMLAQWEFLAAMAVVDRPGGNHCGD